MVIAAKGDLIRPSLLDRLTDDEPRAVFEPPHSYSFSLSQIRALILRDLSWLLNTTQLAATIDLKSYPHVAASTLNYGVCPLGGHIIDGPDTAALGQEIAASLRRFEPRLLADSVSVTILKDADSIGSLGFKIEAHFWAQPVPLRIVVRTDLDPEREIVRIVKLAAEIT
ncbi:type VI secretion system baseplate subunit TssE [Rhizobium sp. NLR9b]|uniref:type VI secretion system baseplate subunit TssE n=1 Tax=unclassified Rhizobium TaxID=2613769 RepID=UPI001C83FA4B|nr:MULTISPECIES: type VI secretion system baseplate subunit TssE [unclassified Rhizobium]MBX5230608.1 type VI secretion system baseplate subunit TssE [Rhizobium sp. NLR9b]MBX5291276.1 type VI secretion system baseplate subunit TssE [Rhizobium sp. NLR10b]